MGQMSGAIQLLDSYRLVDWLLMLLYRSVT
jgi:hypothetical protein